MRNLLTLIFLVGILNSAKANGIPKIMPEDFTIHYTSRFGHNPHYLGIDLSLKECHAMMQDSVLTLFSFTISKEELSTIYSALYSLKAFAIKSKQAGFRARGGEKTEYIISGKTYVVNNSGTHYVIKNQLDHFIESLDLITGCADRHRH